MKFTSISLSFLLSVSPIFAVDYITGTLIDLGGGEFKIVTSAGEFELEASEEIAKSLPSLANPTFVKQSNGNPYSYEFKGDKNGKVFKLVQTPTNIPGAHALRGILKYNKEAGAYSIGDTRVEFGYTKVLNHYEFDQTSKQSFVGEEVIAEGDMRGDVLIMQALSPANLFSATKAESSPYDNLFEADAKAFMKTGVYKNSISKAKTSFRKTVYEQSNYQVKEGESVFLVTLSGRQGDSFGSVNGHFVAGLGEVKKDLSLRAEVSNAYVTNGKDILSGNTSLSNYFSNLVQGQNNYRPTYTFIAYGMDKEKLKKFRDFLEPSHVLFRTQDLDITLEFNCTTETAKGLSLAGIVGNHKRTFANRVFDLNNLAIPFRVAKVFGEAGEAFGFTSSNDKEDFQPRPAFHSYIDSLMNKSVIKELGIKRMDYIFYAQIPSGRPVGGAPSNYTFNVRVKHDSLFYKNLYDRYENEDTKTEEIGHDKLLELLQVLDKVE